MLRQVFAGMIVALSSLPVPASERPQEAATISGMVLVNSIGMKLAFIPPGRFWMGSPVSEPGRDDQEHRHRVEISRGFYMGVLEVTQAQYECVMEKNPSRFAAPGVLDPAALPVDSVAWHEAVEFCRRLSNLPEERAAGRAYRLPTEAEWEYACRAGSRTIWHFGDDAQQLEQHAWYRHQPWRQRTCSVGQKQPNRLGLYDMYGNVWEWCRDWHAADYYLDSAATDPQGPPGGTAKVLRGGSWYSAAYNCRSASRRSDPPVVGDPDTGFRVVCILQEKNAENSARGPQPKGS